MFLDLKGKSESEKNTAKWGEEEEYRTCRTPGGGGVSDFPGGGVTDKPVECSKEQAITLVVLWRA